MVLLSVLIIIILKLRSVLGSAGEETDVERSRVVRNKPELRLVKDSLASPIDQFVQSLAVLDKEFSQDDFLQKAQIVYKMIMKAYIDGDRKTLQSFMSEDVLEQFEKKIKKYEKAGKFIEIISLSISKSTIDDFDLLESCADIKVHFTGVMKYTIEKDKKKSVSKEDAISDLWVFRRDFKQKKSKNWILISAKQKKQKVYDA